jgi:hypothetical protein
VSVKAWFLSWFGISSEPIDAAAGEPLYVAGPIEIARDANEFTVRQACGVDARGNAMGRSWAFASAAEMKKQLDEFGGAATAPELLAELELAGEAEPIAVDVVL